MTHVADNGINMSVFASCLIHQRLLVVNIKYRASAVSAAAVLGEIDATVGRGHQ
jgi:hypothetical protein